MYVESVVARVEVKQKEQVWREVIFTQDYLFC